MGELDISTLILSRFSQLDLVLVAINSLLLLFSRPIFTRFTHTSELSDEQVSRLHYFRAANGLILLVVLFYNFVLPISDHSLVTRGLAVLLVLYLGYLGYHVADFVIKKKFGRKSDVNGQMVVTETYNSRILGLTVAVLMFIVTLIGSVRVLGFETLLEAGGVLGFIGVMLALTQGAWAPDIIGGLIILNSRVVREGDVVRLNSGGDIMGVVFKTKIFHTEILNMVNNHRIMIPNSKLRQGVIQNLSRFASARGLREMLTLKIGYEVDQAAVESMVKTAFDRLLESGEGKIEVHTPVEVRPTDAGDFAVSWSIFYYTKDVKNLLQNQQIILAEVLAQAANDKLSLATPVLNSINGQLESVGD